MVEAVNVDWLNENSYRSYPVVDGASRVAASGAVLPTGLVVDLSLPVPLGTLEPSNAFIRKVYGFSAGVVITIGDTTAPGEDLATATVFTADHARNKSYPLTGIPGTKLNGVTGRIAIGLPEAVAQCSLGLFDFSGAPQNTQLVVSCIRPLLQGVHGVVVRQADGSLSPVLGGSITLIPGDNVTLEVDPVTNSIRISASIQVTPQQVTNAGCGCDTGLEDDLGCIKTINGVQPDAAGNLVIQGLDCVQLTPSSGGNGLVLSDACTEPCCGCDQLDQLQAALQAIENYRSQLGQAADQLEARISNLTTVVLNAGLNPPSTPPAIVAPACWWWLPISGTGYGVIVPCPT